MSVHYLVDYENVHEAGLYGMDVLNADDCVFIFHTSVNDRISLSRLDNVQAWVKVIPVPPGKQSLDMHLSSFLGYQIGKEDPETRFVIVSHDSDYRNIADFWNKAYLSGDKVLCVHGIKYMDKAARPDVWASVPADYSAWRSAVRKFVEKVFSKHAVIGLSSAPSILVSELCTRLNALPEYIQDRKRTGKKPMQYLVEECSDYLWIRKQWGQEWAYLLTAQVGEPVQAPAGEVVEEPAAEVVAEVPAEEDVPDIMELGDLTIDDPVLSGETEAETVAVIPAEAVEEETPGEPDFLACALEYLQNADESVRNASGLVRVSALRDSLLLLPGFRAALKESGMKPIPFIQQLFSGSLEFRREKGIWWAGRAGEKQEGGDNGQNAAAAARKKQFYEKAFSNIRSQLTDAGLDEAVADEIAGICMRSDGDTEPRKLIHMLLCQRFGPKAGAKYYRQAVKYICA